MSLLMSLGLVSGLREELEQISFAVPGPILENSDVRNFCSVLEGVHSSMFINIPSSTP